MAITQDAKIVSSKGKAREDTHWQLGWWELQPLVAETRRHIAWLKSSVICTPHSTQPILCARHFPSSRQFHFPSPPEVANAPASYQPPTIISASQSDEWVFAFFPGNDGDGVGCLWKKGFQIDNWSMRDSWVFPRGAGVVTAEWICPDREWAISEFGVPSRLPPRGPAFHTNSSTLLLVTENHQLHLCVPPALTGSVRVLKTSLQRTHATREPTDTPPPLPEDLSGYGGGKKCVRAAIGFAYNESIVLVATRSHLLPSTNPHPDSFTSMDMVLDIAAPSILPDSLDASGWEHWGEESQIDLCALHIEYNGFHFGIISRPLRQLSGLGSQLVGLTFAPSFPEAVHPSAMTVDEKPPRPTNGKGKLYLAATFLNFDGYSSPPKSKVHLFELERMPEAGNSWIARSEHTRTFDIGTLVFLESLPSKNGLLAGFLDSAGSSYRRGGVTKEVSIGSISVLTLPSLETNDNYEPSRLISASTGLSHDIPVSLAVSPNHTLLSTITSSSILSSNTTVLSLPRQRCIALSSSNKPKGDLSRSLAAALFSRRVPSDVIHALTLKTTSYELVQETLNEAWCVLEVHASGIRDVLLQDMFGIITEVYLGRSRTVEDETEKANLTEQWKVAHDICSITALNAAFDDCYDGESYDLEAIWQLIGLSSWFVQLLERIVKQCIYVAEGNPSLTSLNRNKVKLLDPEDSLQSPCVALLLLVVHPYTLNELQEAWVSVKRFHDYLVTQTPKSINSKISKDALMDIFETSGVHLASFGTTLETTIKMLPTTSDEDQKKALLQCTLTPPLHPGALLMAQQILSSGVIDRPQLFIKPSDLNVEVSHLILAERKKEHNIDVISKGLLTHRDGALQVICTRCGGRSEIGGNPRVAGHASLRWLAWERFYATRCVCGGAWISSTI